MPKAHEPELISRAELARRGGRSRAAVTLACRAELAPAVNGKRVDAAHPVTRLWLARTDSAPTTPRPAKPSRPGKPPKPSKAARAAEQAATKAAAEAEARAEQERAELYKVTLRRRRAEADHLEMRIARDHGRLISRELVRTGVFSYLSELSHRLMNDIPRTLVTRLRSQLPVHESVPIVQDVLGSVIAEAKRRVVLGLERARAPGVGEPPEVHGDQSTSRDPTGPPE